MGAPVCGRKFAAWLRISAARVKGRVAKRPGRARNKADRVPFRRGGCASHGCFPEGLGAQACSAFHRAPPDGPTPRQAPDGRVYVPRPLTDHRALRSRAGGYASPVRFNRRRLADPPPLNRSPPPPIEPDPKALSPATGTPNSMGAAQGAGISFLGWGLQAAIILRPSGGISLAYGPLIRPKQKRPGIAPRPFPHLSLKDQRL